MWLTLKVAAVCLALHLITAVPLALWARSPKAPFRRTLNFVVTLPLVFPPIALGYLLLMALGQTGLGEPLQRLFGVRLIFSQAAVVLAAYIAGLPLVIKPVQAALGSETVRKLTEAARVTGAGPITAFFLVVIPLIRTSLVVGLLLGVTRSFGEVGIFRSCSEATSRNGRTRCRLKCSMPFRAATSSGPRRCASCSPASACVCISP